MSESNGKSGYDSLREQIKLARAERTLRRLQHETRIEEMYFGYTGNSWGDFVDPSDAFRDPDFRGFSSPFVPAGAGRLDRQDGRNRPFVWHDVDLDWMRSQSRWIANRNPIGTGLLDTLCCYTTRTGYTYEARPGRRYLEDATAKTLTAQVQEVVEEFLSLNTLGESPAEQFTWAERERDTVMRSARDGEVFIRTFDQGDGTTLARFIEPEQIRMPLGSSPEWTFGIHTDPNDIERVYGYAVSYSHPDDWEEVPVEDISHLKMNVDSCVKRGLSDFFSTGQAIDETWKLLRNLRVVGCVQSAIPWIEQFEAASSTQVQSYIESKRDQNRPQLNNPISGRPTNYRRYEPGEIPHVGKGRQYVDQPSAGNVPNHVAVVQAALRSVGVRWGFPEHMISGDASNNNYASILVAGSPFVVRTECRQAMYGRFFLRVIWSAIRNAARARRFQLNGHVFTWQEVSRYVDVVPTPPAVAIANQQQEASIDHQDLAAGVLSIQTRRARRGLDNDQEERNLAEKPPTRVSGQATDIDPQGNPVKPGADGGGGEQQPEQPGDSTGLSSLLGENKRSRGEVWKGQSGKWFTINDRGHVVPAAAPGTPDNPHKKGVINHVLAVGKQAKGGASRLLRKLKIAVGKQTSPETRKKLGKVATYAAAVEHKVMTGFTKAKEMAESVAQERGASPEAAKRTAQILSTVDVALAWTVNMPVTAAATGSMTAAKVSSWVPIASLAYLAYSTARNPMATLRAAKQVVKNSRKGSEEKHESVDPNATGELVSALDAADDPDLFMAIVMAALDANGHNLAEAVKLAIEATTGHKEESKSSTLSSWAEDTTPRRPGEVWKGQSGRWFTVNNNGHVVPAKAPGKEATASGAGSAKADSGKTPAPARKRADSKPTDAANKDPGSQASGKDADDKVPAADPAEGRPTRPEERHKNEDGTPKKPPIVSERPEFVPPRGESKAPRDESGKPITGYSANGIANTYTGDMVEDAFKKLNLRPVQGKTKAGKDARSHAAGENKEKGSSLDREYDHSGHLFEMKAVCIEATEFKAAPKKEELDDKRRYCEMHKAQGNTMIIVLDTDNLKAHAYWKEGIGAAKLTANNASEWNYAGSVEMDAEIVAAARAKTEAGKANKKKAAEQNT